MCNQFGAVLWNDIYGDETGCIFFIWEFLLEVLIDTLQITDAGLLKRT